jgi:LuxR family quorum-sensing system transcriptional regulator CciR
MNNQVADFLTAVEAVRSLDELWATTAGYLAGLGFTHSIYAYVDPSDPERTRVWTSLPPSWRERYFDQNYQKVDPYFRYCCSTFSPIRTGGAYLEDHFFLTEPERLVVLEGGETGFQTGFSAPVRLRGTGGFGGWNFGSGFRRTEFESVLRERGRDLRLAAFYIHEHAERLSHGTIASRPAVGRLTRRERECLLWLSRGLRTAAIADRLGVAEVTVDLHFRGARRKLNAATREEALAKAILYGLIVP